MNVFQIHGIARWRRDLLGGMPPSKSHQSAKLQTISRHQVTLPKDPDDAPGRIAALHKAASEGRYEPWIWETDSSIPELPQRGKAA
jgi:hypothetical protein